MSISVLVNVYSPKEANPKIVPPSDDAPKPSTIQEDDREFNSAFEENFVNNLTNPYVKSSNNTSKPSVKDLKDISEWVNRSYEQDIVNSNLQTVPYADKNNLIEKYSTVPELVKKDQFVNEFQNFSTNIVNETLGTGESTEKPIHKLVDVVSYYGIYDSGQCMLKVVPIGAYERNKDFSTRLIKAKSGDVVEVLIEDNETETRQPYIFVGYVSTITTSYDGDGQFVLIQCSSFLSRLNMMGYLATAEYYGIDLVEQVKINRFCPLLIQQLRLGNYLQHVPIFHDLDKIYYYSLFSMGDTQMSILQKICSQFSRLFFQRRNGDLYITQMYNKSLQDKFKSIEWKDIQKNALSIYHNEDYGSIPYHFVLSYANSPLLNKSLSAATYDLINAPNKDSVFKSISGGVVEYPTNSNLSSTFGYIQTRSIDSNLVDLNVQFQNKEDFEKANFLVNLMKFQSLQEAYNYIPSIERFSIRLPFLRTYMDLDIGDMVNIPDNPSNEKGENKIKNIWVISSMNINYASTYLDLTLIPLENTTPALQLTSSEALTPP